MESGRDILRGDEVHDNEQKASERSRTPVIAAEISGRARNTVKFRLLLPHDRGSSSAPVLRLSALAEFADRAFGVGVVDTHAFANLRLTIEQVFGMSDPGVGGVALDDVMFSLTDDGATIATVLGLSSEGLCGIPEHLRRNRLGLNEGVAARRVNGTPSVRRRLLRVYIDGTAAWFVTRCVLG